MSELNSENTENDLSEAIEETVDDATVITVPIDNTLSVSGEAADAYAVGQALAQKADKSELQTSITVNGQSADNQGVILVTAEDTEMSDSDDTTIAEAIRELQERTGASIPIDATAGAESIKSAIENATGRTAAQIKMSDAENAATIAAKIAEMDATAEGLAEDLEAVDGKTGADIPISAAAGAKTIQEAIEEGPLTVNNIPADENRHIQIDEVPWADNLSTSHAIESSETFRERTTAGAASVETGGGWLMRILGNRTHAGYIAQSVNMTVIPMTREAEEGETPAEAITATIDDATFLAEMENNSGTFSFLYTTGWNNDPADYGITVTGDPIAGDQITVAYQKEIRGTITQSNPQSFVSTGWNLYQASGDYTGYTGYAKVVPYSEQYGYKIAGTYTGVFFSETPEGTKSEVTVSGDAFTIETAGYVFITGGGADTEIWTTWSDWVEEANGGTHENYTESVVDLSDIMEEYFPNGLLRVGDIRDEINLNTGYAISNVQRLAYTAENRASAAATGRAYEFDENYIYLERAASVTTAISIYGGFDAHEYGIEFFTGTAIPIYAETIYGLNLKNKLERDVLTISQQTLTDSQKKQVQQNIGWDRMLDVLKITGISSLPYTYTGLTQHGYALSAKHRFLKGSGVVTPASAQGSDWTFDFETTPGSCIVTGTFAGSTAATVEADLILDL